MQIQHAKERKIINLRTANKEEAATLARNFYRELLKFGWDEALRRHKGIPATEKKINVTIGEYLSAVREKSLIYPKTLKSYSVALRKIASDIHGLDSSSRRAAWRAQVDNVKLATLTSETIEEWQSVSSSAALRIRSRKRAPRCRQTVSLGEPARSSELKSSRESKISVNFQIRFHSLA